jgi:hypothetical protein
MLLCVFPQLLSTSPGMNSVRVLLCRDGAGVRKSFSSSLLCVPHDKYCKQVLSWDFLSLCQRQQSEESEGASPDRNQHAYHGMLWLISPESKRCALYMGEHAIHRSSLSALDFEGEAQIPSRTVPDS